MDTSRSFIKTVLARIRGYLDDPDFDAKYYATKALEEVRLAK